jgi:tRNA pseudouridine38-40 synthase
MPRYFIEVSYKGTNYSGFQIQHNANSIQAEIERALKTFFKKTLVLTGASRTDAGVHALQNYFHFDDESLSLDNDFLYSLNSILPQDIIIKNISTVKQDAHCRFDAIEREYKYSIYQNKNPFLSDRAFYYPYSIDIEKLQEAAKLILDYEDFTSFSKRNTQVQNFLCSIYKSEWIKEEESIVYSVVANRFLRGMVRGLVGTMLKIGTGKITTNEFKVIIESHDCALADFSVPSHGLFLIRIKYKSSIFL